MYVVLVYDVSQQENGSKRWSRIFKICKRYLTHIQNSVFEGEISKAQLAQLQQELKFCIDKELDSVIIFKSRQEVDKAFIYKENGSFIECYNIYFVYKIIVNDKVDRKW